LPQAPAPPVKKDVATIMTRAEAQEEAAEDSEEEAGSDGGRTPRVYAAPQCEAGHTMVVSARHHNPAPYTRPSAVRTQHLVVANAVNAQHLAPCSPPELFITGAGGDNGIAKM
jgi:tetrahydromethanopterin S-methyltransferase subunit E